MQAYLRKGVAVFLAQLFLLLPPSAKAQFDLVFASNVALEGDPLVFVCLHKPGDFIEVEWYLNDTLYTNATSQNVDIDFSAASGVGILSILSASLVYNSTRIGCVGTSAQGNQLNSTDHITYVQGELPPVRSLTLYSTNSTIFISWTDPFIPEVYPEISNYCVTVTVNSTTNFTTLHATCSLNQTESGFDIPIPPMVLCETVDFAVVVMNSVGNGSRSVISYFPMREDSPELVEFSLVPSIAVLSYPLCDAQVEFEDIHTGEIIALLDTDINIIETNIIFSTHQLKENRRYNVTISALTTIISSARIQVETSTHDIIQLATTAIGGSDIQVTATFLDNSDATGALLFFVRLTNMTLDLDDSYHLALSNTRVSSSYVMPFDFHPGLYEVYAYDVESSKTLLNGIGYPARRTSVVVTQSKVPDPRHNDGVGISCDVTSRSRVIAVNCSFQNTSNVLGLQIIVQIPDIDSVGILNVNASMDLLTPPTLKVPRDGEYLVTVLPILVGTGILSGMALSRTYVVGAESTTQKGFSPLLLTLTTKATTPESSDPLELIIGVAVGAVIILTLGVVVTIMTVHSNLKSRQRKILLNNFKAFLQ